jgi:hypothetical protein
MERDAKEGLAECPGSATCWFLSGFCLSATLQNFAFGDLPKMRNASRNEDGQARPVDVRNPHEVGRVWRNAKVGLAMVAEREMVCHRWGGWR